MQSFTVEGPLTEQERSQLFTTAIRAKIHVHEKTPCDSCVLDTFNCGQYTLALLEEIRELRKRLRGAKK